MKVLKTNGSIQDFDLSRILLTIERLSDEANVPLNASDLNNLGRAIEKNVMNCGSDIIHIDTLNDIITSILIRTGFKDFTNYYITKKKAS